MFLKYKVQILCLIVLILGLCAQCGTKSAVKITVVIDHSVIGKDPFDPANGAVDILFIAKDLTDGTKVLGYPENCFGNPYQSAGCGFTLTENYNLELCFKECGPENAYIPPADDAQIIFCARNSSGTVIFRGVSNTFKNDPSLGPQAVTITVSEVSIALCQ